MATPGFNASSSLYRTSRHYRMGVGVENVSETMAVPALVASTMGVLPLAASPVPSSPQLLPEVIGPLPLLQCQPCSLNESGECTQYCVHCPDPYNVHYCWASTTPCAECCPEFQSPCYVIGNRQFCCGRAETCCDPVTNWCCPSDTPICCNPATRKCCPSGQTPCCGPGGDLCCGPGELCCDPGNACADIQTDLSNCGGCGNVCPPGPANSTRTCINGKCGWACNSGYTKCVNACCPAGYGCCNDVCTPLNTTDNCGGCGNVCRPSGPANSTATCINGQCGWVCNSGYTKCVNACCPPGYGCCNGVCTPLNTTDNCGACGRVCPPGPANSTRTCINGQCGWACNSGYTQCDNACCSSQCPGGIGCLCEDGVCDSGLICVNGTCIICGQPERLCCPGYTCSSGLTCQYSDANNSYICLP